MKNGLLVIFRFNKRSGVIPLAAPWPTEYIEYLKKNWNKKSPEQIAKYIGRTPSAVANKAQKMGLGSGWLSAVKNIDKKTVGVDYKTALPPEQWPMAVRLMKMMEFSRMHAAKCDGKIKIDLQELRDCFAAMDQDVDVWVTVLDFVENYRNHAG